MLLYHGHLLLHSHQEQHTQGSMEIAGLSSVSEFSVTGTSMAVTVPHSVWPGMIVEVTMLVDQMGRRYAWPAGVSLLVIVQHVSSSSPFPLMEMKLCMQPKL